MYVSGASERETWVADATQSNDSPIATCTTQGKPPSHRGLWPIAHLPFRGVSNQHNDPAHTHTPAPAVQLHWVDPFVMSICNKTIMQPSQYSFLSCVPAQAVSVTGRGFYPSSTSGLLIDFMQVASSCASVSPFVKWE